MPRIAPADDPWLPTAQGMQEAVGQPSDEQIGQQGHGGSMTGAKAAVVPPMLAVTTAATAAWE
ncbi:hypothetical protein [Streptomyces sp. NPDC007205]|uniref:hypothetical protein n=1 Tax=Streptomyces sp. NPDC007205 TaxID=3154316 RepID=UPI0033D80DB4